MPNQDEWARSICPYCGRSFPHKKGENPVTCGNLKCLQEAVWWAKKEIKKE